MKPSRRGESQPRLPFPPETAAPPTRRPGKRRLPRRVRVALAGAASLGLLMAGAVILFRSGEKTSPPAEEAGTLSLPETPPWTTVEETVDRGETLSEILARHGLTSAEIDRFVKAVKPVFDFKRIRAGRTLKLALDENGALRALEYPTDERSYILVTNDAGTYAAAKKEYPFEKRWAYIDGVIEDSLYDAVVARKENPTLSWLIEQLFGWDIDFWAGLRRGDAFRAVFEKYYVDGRFASYGEVVAAEFLNQGELFQAFRYQYPDTGKADHFDAAGKSLRKEFLKSPLLGRGRLTSRFSASRLHPIRKVYRAHFGVDFAAPEGTPVYATADGTVEEAGLSGASGRMIRLRHKRNYETYYLHLARILVKKGDRVEGGKQIGTVGSSGESTGPHLDYRIKEGGVYINPLSKKFDPVEPLRPAFKDDFGRSAAALQAALDAPLSAIRK